VHRVEQAIAKMQSSNASVALATALATCKEHWKKISAVGDAVIPVISDTNSSESHTSDKCALCCMPAVVGASDASLRALWWTGRVIHTQCANLWANRVSADPPIQSELL